jgi:hypothetical protein
MIQIFDHGAGRQEVEAAVRFTFPSNDAAIGTQVLLEYRHLKNAPEKIPVLLLQQSARPRTRECDQGVLERRKAAASAGDSLGQHTQDAD